MKVIRWNHARKTASARVSIRQWVRSRSVYLLHMRRGCYLVSARQQAENEKLEMRRRLEQQLSMILETRESARGLIVNISDVLFDFNKYTLKPGAREKMAKVAGILLAYPGPGFSGPSEVKVVKPAGSDRRAMGVRP